MTRVVEADENGAIRLAGEWLGSKPHARYIIESQGDQLVLRPADATDERPLWERLSPEQWAQNFQDWIGQQTPAAVHLTDEQLRRENLYD